MALTYIKDATAGLAPAKMGLAWRRFASACRAREDMRARALRGVNVNADDLVRMQRLADLSVRRLNLPAAASKPALDPLSYARSLDDEGAAP